MSGPFESFHRGRQTLATQHDEVEDVADESERADGDDYDAVDELLGDVHRRQHPTAARRARWLVSQSLAIPRRRRRQFYQADNDKIDERRVGVGR